MEEIKNKLLFLKALDAVITDAEIHVHVNKNVCSPNIILLGSNAEYAAEATIEASQRLEELSMLLQTRTEHSEYSAQYNVLVQALKTASEEELSWIYESNNTTGDKTVPTCGELQSQIASFRRECAKMEDELNELSYKSAELTDELTETVMEPEEITSPEIDKLKQSIERRKARTRILQGILGKLLWGGNFDVTKNVKLIEILASCDHQLA